MLLVDSEAALRTLTSLRAKGVKVAIDDFGTGYSSLSYLRRLPLDKLKLDQSFIRDAGNEGDVAITRAIIAMAHSLKLAVVAEGRGDPGADRPSRSASDARPSRASCSAAPCPRPATAKLLREGVVNPDARDARQSDTSWATILRPGRPSPAN